MCSMICPGVFTCQLASILLLLTPTAVVNTAPLSTANSTGSNFRSDSHSSPGGGYIRATRQEAESPLLSRGQPHAEPVPQTFAQCDSDITLSRRPKHDVLSSSKHL